MPSLLAAADTFGVGLADLEEAERARLVAVAGRSLTFRHPLISAAAYQGATAARRIAAHQALADSADSPDCRARHRASAALAPDEDVAADLQEAAERARVRAGHATAAALYRQAADLTPAREARAARLGAAASLTLQAGRLDEAGDLAVHAEKLGAADLAGLARVHAAVEYERGDQRRGPHDGRPRRRAGARGDAPHRRHVRVDVRRAYRRAARVRAPAGRPDAPRPRATRRRRPRGRPAAARRAGHRGPRRRRRPAARRPARADHRRGRRGARTGRRRGRALPPDGLVGELPTVLQVQAQTQIAAGRHADAAATVAEAIALARDTGRPHREGRLGAVLARVAAIEGDEPRLRELTASAPPDLADGAFALLDLGLGRYDDALRRLAHDPHGDVLSAADQVEAALRAGDAAGARGVHPVPHLGRGR